MTFPRYESYKDSGVEWLGEVPEHWRLKKIKHFARFSGGGTPSREKLEYWNGDIPWVSPKDMKGEAIHDAEERITSAGLEQSSATLRPSGEVLVVVRSGILKHTIPIAINQVPVALNQDMKAVSFRKAECLPRFFLRWVQGLNDQLLRAWGKQGATVESIEHSYLAETVLPLPSPVEQFAIAAFLDRETTKIDALVDAQERLIDLLKEKRQAVISHAVTKGINPNVPMNDSGVEWLGQVPRHWDVKRLKHISPLITVGIVVNPSDYVSLEGLPFIYGGNITERRIDTEGARRISADDSERNRKTRLSTDDLVTVRVGAPGVTAVVPPECEGGNCASVMLTKKGECSSQWLCYAMNSRMVRYQVELVQYGAAQEQFNIGHAVNFWIATPPRKEQGAIAHALDCVSGRLDSLMDEVKRGNNLLQERRSALISAAVTGKIDVRGLASPEKGRHQKRQAALSRLTGHPLNAMAVDPVAELA